MEAMGSVKQAFFSRYLLIGLFLLMIFVPPVLGVVLPETQGSGA